jgi:hypothetical protein
MERRKEKWQIRKPATYGIAAAVIAAVISAGSARAQDPYVYPSRGQSNEQMEQDKFSCYQWAKGQTGFDPMQAPQASAPPQQQRGGALRGAAGGAAMGAAIGAIAGNAGKGAAIGAASGGIIGGARQAQSNKQQEQYAQQQSAQYNQQRGDYNRAWGACMSGRGYTVQ